MDEVGVWTEANLPFCHCRLLEGVPRSRHHSKQTNLRLLTCTERYNAANHHSDKDSTCPKVSVRDVIHCVPG